jgi:hypothetical protein
VGPRALIVTGMALAGGAMFYLTRLSVTSGYAGHLLPALLPLGLGFGMIFSPAINTATAGVDRRDSGVASALVNTMQQVGGSVGTAALSTVALTATATYLTAHHSGPPVMASAIASVHGYDTAFMVSAVLFGFGALLALILLPSRRRLAQSREPFQVQAVAGDRPASLPGQEAAQNGILVGEPPSARTAEPAEAGAVAEPC